MRRFRPSCGPPRAARRPRAAVVGIEDADDLLEESRAGAGRSEGAGGRVASLARHDAHRRHRMRHPAVARTWAASSVSAAADHAPSRAPAAACQVALCPYGRVFARVPPPARSTSTPFATSAASSRSIACRCLVQRCQASRSRRATARPPSVRTRRACRSPSHPCRD
jgi:hypothetical protein